MAVWIVLVGIITVVRVKVGGVIGFLGLALFPARSLILVIGGSGVIDRSTSARFLPVFARDCSRSSSVLGNQGN